MNERKDDARFFSTQQDTTSVAHAGLFLQRLDEFEREKQDSTDEFKHQVNAQADDLKWQEQ